ncbi:hypothetical protein JTB14_032892 [Gonioctena quinquepunctata]|nr:hypothetical protein JTB14_032892 [Gonioctena quinquepunctata]
MENYKTRPSVSDCPHRIRSSPRKALREIIAERRQNKMESSEQQTELMDPYEAVNNYKDIQEKKTGYVEEESPLHFCYWDPNYPENPERVACSKRR